MNRRILTALTFALILALTACGGGGSSPAPTPTPTPTGPVSITTTSIPDGVVNEDYLTVLQATGGAPAYSWTLTSGSLPAGLTMDKLGGISGRPTASGSFTFTVQATDTATPAGTATKQFTLRVSASRLVFRINLLPKGTLGAAYSGLLPYVGGLSPLTWRISGGSLPAGLVIDGSTGQISGVPLLAGSSTFTVELKDSGNPQQTVTTTQTVVVTQIALGRNDDVAHATPLTAAMFAGGKKVYASISPLVDPENAAQVSADQDWYKVTATVSGSPSIVTIKVVSSDVVPASPMDPVMQITDANGAQLPNICRNVGTGDGLTLANITDTTPTAFDDPCINDDIDVGVIHDSQLDIDASKLGGQGATVTIYFRVLDWGGRARPDMVYNLSISGIN